MKNVEEDAIRIEHRVITPTPLKHRAGLAFLGLRHDRVGVLNVVEFEAHANFRQIRLDGLGGLFLGWHMGSSTQEAHLKAVWIAGLSEQFLGLLWIVWIRLH